MTRTPGLRSFAVLPEIRFEIRIDRLVKHSTVPTTSTATYRVPTFICSTCHLSTSSSGNAAWRRRRARAAAPRSCCGQSVVDCRVVRAWPVGQQRKEGRKEGSPLAASLSSHVRRQRLWRTGDVDLDLSQLVISCTAQ